MDVFDKLALIAEWANAAANGTFLLAGALVALILAAVGVVWMHDRIRRYAATPRRPESTGGLDELLRDALDDEADRLAAEWERREGDR